MYAFSFIIIGLIIIAAGVSSSFLVPFKSRIFSSPWLLLGFIKQKAIPGYLSSLGWS